MYTPGTRLLIVRTLASGRTVQLTGTVIEDYGYGLLWRDDRDGHRRHMCTDPERLGGYCTQTITVLTASLAA